MVEPGQDFKNFYTVQMGENRFYGFENNANPACMLKFSWSNERGEMQDVEVARPLTARGWPSLCGFMNRFIFVSGGYNSGRSSYYSSVDVYNVATNSWKEVLKLNVPRSHHSSCSLARCYVYVFCGQTTVSKKS